MSSLQPQYEAAKAKVLRLKELLDKLRAIAQKNLPENPSIDQISKTFGIEWTTARRFWEERKTGGPKVVSAILAKSGHVEFSAEIQALMDHVSDRLKSLVQYPVPAIEMVFALLDAFEKASHQRGIKTRDQISPKQFGDFFGENNKLVGEIAARSFSMLSGCEQQVVDHVSAVLDSTNWDVVRPSNKSASEPQRLVGKPAQLADLLKQLRPHFSHERAMLDAIPAHHSTVKNALGGKGKKTTLDDLLRKATTLLAKQSDVVAVTITRTQSEQPEVTGKGATKDPQSFIGSFISSLNSFLRMSEAVGIDPENFNDGDRMQIVRFATKLLAKAGIDEKTIERLASGEPSEEAGPNLQLIIRATQRGKR